MPPRPKPGGWYSQAGSARQRQWKIGGKKSQALNGSTLIGVFRLATMNQPFAISQRGVKLFQRERRASAVTIWIRAERQINALRRITKIEVGRFSQAAGAQRPKFDLRNAAERINL